MTTADGLRKIAEGREAEIFAWEDGAVLRLFRGPRDGASVEREAAAMEAARSVVPLVPAILGRTEVDGRPGLIMERIDGPDLLTLLGRKPWWAWRAGTITGSSQARLHDVVAPPALRSIKDRILAMLASSLVPPHVAAFAREELAALPDGDRLLHGDLHPGNILMSSRGPIVIDWPNATRGDPHADLARTLLMFRTATLPPGAPLVVRLGDRLVRKIVLGQYERAYCRIRPFDADLVERWIIVRAADRLAENIVEDRAGVLQLLEEAGVRA